MKVIQLARNISIVVSSLYLTGCASMFTIGEEEFSCPGLPKGVICEGPRKIMEMTDTHENLNAYAIEQQKQRDEAEENWYDILNPFDWFSGGDGDKHEHSNSHLPLLKAYDKGEIIYVSNKGQGTKATEPKIPTTPEEAIKYAKQQQTVQALTIAPDNNAILEPAKVMRIYVAPYQDNSGSLNMPGYVYVEVQEKRWLVGEDANINPAKITPLQVREKSLEQIRAEQNTPQQTNGLGVLKSSGK